MMRATLAAAIALAFALPAGAAIDLPQAYDAAQAVDPTLTSATYNRDAAFENIAIARSRLLPQVALQSTLQQTNQTTTQLGTSRDFDGKSSNTTLTVRQGVFRPKDWVGMDIGKLQADYGRYKLLSAYAELWTRTVDTWIDVLASLTVRDYHARSVESANNASEQEKRRLAAGDGTRDAVAEAAAVLAGTRAQLADAELDLKAKQEAFRALTRLDPAAFAGMRLPDADMTSVRLATLDEITRLAVEGNAELMAARMNEAIAAQRVRQAKADHLPTLDLIGSVTQAENDTTNTLGTKYRNKQAGFQLSVPIFSGGGVSATERQVAAQASAAMADREALEQRLRTQVMAHWNAQNGLRERVVAARQAIASARELRRAAELGIRAGLRTWSDASAADQQIARRGVEYASLMAGLVKTQARMLSLLSPAELAPDQWSRQLSELAKP